MSCYRLMSSPFTLCRLPRGSGGTSPSVAPAKGGGVASSTTPLIRSACRCASRLRIHRPVRSLLEEPQDGLRCRVRLSEHGGTGLEQDLVLREVDHLRRHVGVLDRAFRSL